MESQEFQVQNGFNMSSCILEKRSILFDFWEIVWYFYFILLDKCNMVVFHYFTTIISWSHCSIKQLTVFWSQNPQKESWHLSIAVHSYILSIRFDCSVAFFSLKSCVLKFSPTIRKKRCSLKFCRGSGGHVPPFLLGLQMMHCCFSIKYNFQKSKVKNFKFKMVSTCQVVFWKNEAFCSIFERSFDISILSY